MSSEPVVETSPASANITTAVDSVVSGDVHPTSDADLEDKILRQVEFYFGNSNLPRDRFLSEEVRKNDGWVPLELVASFQRMKRLSEDIEVIKRAIAKSTELLELNEDRSQVRRRLPMPETLDTISRTIYAKGFPKDAMLEELEAFFGQYTNPLAIRFRRVPKSEIFKGSVFVELETAEEAKRVLDLPLEYKGVKLVMHSKAEYFVLKNEEVMGKNKKREDAQPIDYTKGCLAKLSDLPDGLTHVQIKELLNPRSEVAFADIEDDRSTAWIRFKEPVAAEMVQYFSEEANSEALMYNGAKLGLKLATEEEEQKYFERLAKVMAEKRKNDRGGRGGRRGGRDGKRGSRGGRLDLHQASNKKAKTEDIADEE